MTLTWFFQQKFSIEESVGCSSGLLVTYLVILMVLWLSNILVED